MAVNHVQCPMCRGVKVITGLGLMMHDCPECEAVGYIKQTKIDDHVATEITETLQQQHDKIKPQRGRPKLIQLQDNN